MVSNRGGGIRLRRPAHQSFAPERSYGSSAFIEGSMTRPNWWARTRRIVSSRSAGSEVPPQRPTDFAVFAFDAATGAILWESLADPSGLGFGDVAYSLSQHGSRLSRGRPNRQLRRVARARLRRPHWTGPSGKTRYRTAISSRGEAVAGEFRWPTVCRCRCCRYGGPEDLTIRAYDESTGSLLWSHVEDGGGLMRCWPWS